MMIKDRLNEILKKCFPERDIDKNYCSECGKDITDGGFLLTTSNGLVRSCSNCIETILNKEEEDVKDNRE